jgi:5-methylcytosine-specific restriction enzyme subunit McrC
MREPIVLSEYQTRTGVELSAEEAAAFAATGAVQVTPIKKNRWKVKATKYVGVLRAGDVELWVRPKVTVERLIYVLGFASNLEGWRDDDVGLVAVDDLVPAVASAFAKVAQRALATGVLQGYREREESLPVLRGRLREADQVRRRPGLALPVEVRYNAHTVDIAENQRLLAAARGVLGLPGVQQEASSILRHLISKLHGVTIPPPGQLPPTPPATRLNERYQPALRLAEIILAGQGVEARTGAVRATGFVFDMNKVFEDYLTAAMTIRLERHSGHVRGQHKLWLDTARKYPIFPDITWWHGPRCAAVIDAKYKAPASGKPPTEDVYQLVAYCTVLGLSSGHLVYAGGPRPPQTLTIRNTGITLTIHTLDLNQPKAELSSDLDRLAATVSKPVDVAGAHR